MSSTATNRGTIAFDQIAEDYDRVFSFTPVGIAQRKAVWKQVKEVFRAGDSILELNCGTGEDACFLASRGMRVVGLDASPQMIVIARRKSQSFRDRVSFEVLASERLAELPGAQPFDGVFSNFSGLNCVEDLGIVARALGARTRAGAPVLLCFSTRVCLWEVGWYAAHGDLRRAFRRLTRTGCEATVGASTLKVFYPSVAKIRRAFAPWFRLRSVRAIGLAVPPSYLNPIAAAHPRLLAMAEDIDRSISGFPLVSRLGDHVLLCLERTSA